MDRRAVLTKILFYRKEVGEKRKNQLISYLGQTLGGRGKANGEGKTARPASVVCKKWE